MSYWAQQAMHKRQREKTASKATREGLMEAYRKGREEADERQRKANMEWEGKDGVQTDGGLEKVPAADGEVGGEPLSALRAKEDR